MSFIKTTDSVEIGDEVILTERKESMLGYFEIDTRVKITDIDQMRGYSFEDNEGNRIIEAGFDGFRKLNPPVSGGEGGKE